MLETFFSDDEFAINLSIDNRTGGADGIPRNNYSPRGACHQQIFHRYHYHNYFGSFKLILAILRSDVTLIETVWHNITFAKVYTTDFFYYIYDV